MLLIPSHDLYQGQRLRLVFKHPMLKHNRNGLNNLYVNIDSSDDHFYTLRSRSCQSPTCDKNIYAGPTWPTIITSKYIKAPIHSSARLENYVY